MSVSIIVAKSENNCIGIDGKLPWHLPADLKHFKEITSNSTVIMGRKTFESIVSLLGHPLPNRRNVVVTRNPAYRPDDAEVIHSLPDAVGLGGNLFVIGGAQIYEQALPLADTLYITNVHTHVDGDAFFPVLNEDEWQIVNSETHQHDDINDHDYTFLTYERA